MASFEDYLKKNKVFDKQRISTAKEDSKDLYTKTLLPAEHIEEKYAIGTTELYDNNMWLLRQNLVRCLDKIEDEVLKGYLEKIDCMPVVPLTDTEINSLKDIQFFQITELVCQEGELSVSKLATLYSAFCDKPCTLVLRICSDGIHQKIYLGVRSRAEKYSTRAMLDMLQHGLTGLFPGSRSQSYYAEDLATDLAELKPQALSSVTCVADFRQKEEQLSNDKFIQGLEKFITAMYGKPYDAFFIADNISRDDLMMIRREYENISTQIYPFTTMHINFSNSHSESKTTGKSQSTTEGTSISEGESEGTSESIGENHSTGQTTGNSHSEGTTENESYGTTKVKGTSEGTSESKTEGKNSSVGISGAAVGAVGGAVIGAIIGGPTGAMMGSMVGSSIGGTISRSSGKSSSATDSVSHTYSESDAISEMLSKGISKSDSISESTTQSQGTSKTTGKSATRSSSKGRSSSVSFVDTDTLGETIGESKGITLDAKNRALQSIVERLEKQLKRIDACESMGMWNFAAYFTGESAAETELAANVYRSVVSGQDTGVQYTAINTWQAEEELSLLMPYIKNFLHPRFAYHSPAQENLSLLVWPAVPVSTKELSIHMGLPNHSVCGLPVINHAIFGQEVLRQSNGGEQISLGNLYHLGQERPNDIGIDLASLTMHTFVSGSTGAGKSNAVYNLLTAMRERDIPFLVVEPAKGEYSKVFSDIPCYGTNPRQGRVLHLNPFSFPESIHVLEHIDRLVEIFSVCWPMYAAMPAVLKQAIERAYRSAGWDISISKNDISPTLFPTFEDVLIELESFVNESAYSSETKGDYVGALSTRLASLTSGLNGQIFSGRETSSEKLFDKSAILDLSRVGAQETKALLMGLIVLKLQEYRMTQEIEMNAELRHLTILEEAHNLLKKTSTEQNSESSNVAGKSVEMITNAIAEMRTFGEGFIIVDQAPNLLDTAAIRNTNTKIVLRLPEGGDRESIGASMALSKKQISEVSKLPTGVAVVYQNDWQEAILVKLPKYSPQPCEQISARIEEDISEVRQNNELLHLLLKNKHEENELAHVEEMILNAHVAASIRKELLLNLREKNQSFQWALADFIHKAYDCSKTLRGTGSLPWKDWKELSDIMLKNLQPEFSEFDSRELHKILLCICRVEQERYPDNRELKEVCTQYLQKEVSFS